MVCLLHPQNLGKNLYNYNTLHLIDQGIDCRLKSTTWMVMVWVQQLALDLRITIPAPAVTDSSWAARYSGSPSTRRRSRARARQGTGSQEAPVRTPGPGVARTLPAVSSGEGQWVSVSYVIISVIISVIIMIIRDYQCQLCDYWRANCHYFVFNFCLR